MIFFQTYFSIFWCTTLPNPPPDIFQLPVYLLIMSPICTSGDNITPLSTITIMMTIVPPLPPPPQSSVPLSMLTITSHQASSSPNTRVGWCLIAIAVPSWSRRSNVTHLILRLISVCCLLTHPLCYETCVVVASIYTRYLPTWCKRSITEPNLSDSN